MGRMEGRIAIITGAALSNGFGYATARIYAREGAKVVLTDINADEVKLRAKCLQDEGHDAIAIAHDVTDQNAWNGVRDLTLEKFGAINVLVNNAGVAFPGGIADATLENWNTHIEINLTSVFLGCQMAVQQMQVQGGGGAIINISSTAGLSAFPNLVAYVSSKGGVRLLTKSAALDVATEGIRINSVHPGNMRTDMVERTLKVAPELVNNSIANIPMKKLGEPEDIGMMNLFLASDDAKYITGSEFVVDGGLTAK